MKKELICITCPNGCRLTAEKFDDGSVTVTGNLCPKGEEFARAELTAPMRSLTTTVRTVFSEMPFLPVRTNGVIPKESVMAVMDALRGIVLENRVRCGDIVVSDISGTGCDIIATLDIP
jgi:CxxC motif-containing protein